MNQNQMSGYLVLESGETFAGQFHGDTHRAGEVVFNTSHSGFEEIATDPSYFSQIVVMTAPMQGNYGAHDEVWESSQFWIEGFICLQLQSTTRENSWQKKLIEAKIPILSEVDTRAITLRLRSGGTPWGALVKAQSPSQAKEIAFKLIEQKKKIEKDWVYLASRKTAEIRKGDLSAGAKIAVLDFGAKENILKELQKRSSEICVFPSRSSAQEILSYKPDAVMLTNGPGDPSDVQVAIQTTAALVGQLPVFGICMGHQILALAIGAKTFKLKFGHRGSNHPIKDDLLNKVYMSSQNHGYAVDPQTLPADAQVTHVNLNDKTLAGFYSEQKNYLGIQYHPESRPGPHDAEGLFDFFIKKMVGKSL